MLKLPKPVRRAWKRASKSLRERVVAGSPEWMRRHLGPVGTYLDMLFVDHGIFRYIYLNKHRIGDRAWRSAQPAPLHLRRAARQGVRTVINLRGERLCGSYFLEQRTCAEIGLNLVNFQVRSRAAPSREELAAAHALFRSVEYPILMHCKSGADRAGLMSTLYRHIALGEPIETARRELSLRYGHIRRADTGILDYFFERYLEDNNRQPMPFFVWVEAVYDPVELKRSFQASGWANRLVNSLLRRE